MRKIRYCMTKNLRTTSTTITPNTSSDELIKESVPFIQDDSTDGQDDSEGYGDSECAKQGACLKTASTFARARELAGGRADDPGAPTEHEARDVSPGELLLHAVARGGATVRHGGAVARVRVVEHQMPLRVHGQRDVRRRRREQR